jgi:hypothetical protein
MEVKISVKPDTLRKKGTIHVKIENEEGIPTSVNVNEIDNSAMGVNNIIYSQRTTGNHKADSGKRAKLQKPPTKLTDTTNKYSTSDITRLLLQMGKICIIISRVFVGRDQ